MKSSLTIVCGDALVTGFDLTGAEVVGVSGVQEADPILQRRLADARWGVVLVDEEIMRALPEVLVERLDACSMPFFVSLPMSASVPEDEADARAEEYVSGMLRKAVGRALVFKV